MKYMETQETLMAYLLGRGGIISVSFDDLVKTFAEENKIDIEEAETLILSSGYENEDFKMLSLLGVYIIPPLMMDDILIHEADLWKIEQNS